MQRQRCYAALLGGCSAKLTREHFVSAAILERLRRLGGLSIEGVPWRAPSNPSVKTLKAKVLCKAHNEALSRLDDEAGRFFAAMGDAATIIESATIGSQTLHTFTGELIERWLLKMLCGAVVSGHARDPSGEVIRSWTPPETWLQMLFGSTPFPANCGLYLVSPSGTSTSAHPRVSFAPLVATPASIRGALITLSGLELMLAMWTQRAATPSERAMYRPRFVRLVRGQRKVQLDISWAFAGDGMGAELDWSPNTQNT